MPRRVGSVNSHQDGACGRPDRVRRGKQRVPRLGLPIGRNCILEVDDGGVGTGREGPAEALGPIGRHEQRQGDIVEGRVHDASTPALHPAAALRQ